MSAPEVEEFLEPHAQQYAILRLGMPHLGFTGMSDSWLLRHLGQMHWDLIEDVMGQPSRDWVNAIGGRLYASFVAISMAGPLMAQAQEGDLIRIASSTERSGTSLFLSEHRLSTANSEVTASAELATILVHRARAGDNLSFLRATDGPTVARGPKPTRRRSALLDAYRLHRTSLHGGIVSSQHRFPIMPLEDFNGAGMVYFANYLRFVDRAAWMTGSTPLPEKWQVRSRRVFYYGNLNVGDGVHVECLAPIGVAARTRLRRAASGDPVAYCETER